MTRKMLEKLRAEIRAMRGNPQKPRVLESLANKLGRKCQKRGKHPMWESEYFNLPALSIPHHGNNQDLSKPVVAIILNQLEEDIACWEAQLEAGDHDEN